MVRRVYRRGLRGRSFFDSLSVVGWLILANVIISVIAFIFWVSIPESINWFALKADNIFQGEYLWTIILHMFSHGGFFHLFINMFVLFSLGGLCERIIGRKRFLWFYLLSGIFAGILTIVLAGLYGGSDFGARAFGSSDVFMVGASGAIFAIAGLFVLLLPRLKFIIIFLPFFSLPAFIMVPLVLVLTWLASFYGGLPIGNVAHFGGFLVGIGYGLYLRVKYSRKVAMLQRHFR